MTNVSLEKLKPIFLYTLAIIMIAVGAITTYWMMAPVFEDKGGEVKGYPIAIIVGGLVIPFIARERKVLVVRMVDKSYKWKPQLVVDSTSRNKLHRFKMKSLKLVKRSGFRHPMQYISVL